MLSRISTIAAIAFSLSASLLSASAAAAPWTFTTTGIIDWGYDSHGVFGTSNGNLAGKAFMMSTVVDPLAFSGQNRDSQYNVRFGAHSGAVTQTVKVGNVTRTFDYQIPHLEGSSVLAISPNRLLVEQNMSGTTSTGEYMSVKHSLMSFVNQFITSTDFTQNFAYNTNSNDYGKANFWLQGFNNTYFESARVRSLAIETATPVPEPAPLALLGLGLIGLALVRRKSA